MQCLLMRLYRDLFSDPISLTTVNFLRGCCHMHATFWRGIRNKIPDENKIPDPAPILNFQARQSLVLKNFTKLEL